MKHHHLKARTKLPAPVKLSTMKSNIGLLTNSSAISSLGEILKYEYRYRKEDFGQKINIKKDFVKKVTDIIEVMGYEDFKILGQDPSSTSDLVKAAYEHKPVLAELSKKYDLLPISFFTAKTEDPAAYTLLWAAFNHGTKYVPSIYNILQNNGYNLDQRDGYENNVLHAAVRSGGFCNEDTLETLKYCFARGIDPSARNTLGFIPLHNAACHRDIVVLRELLKYMKSTGASLDVQDNSGNTAAHYVARVRDSEGNLDTRPLKLLLIAGARADIPDKNGKTVQDICGNTGINEIMSQIKGQLSALYDYDLVKSDSRALETEHKLLYIDEYYEHNPPPMFAFAYLKEKKDAAQVAEVQEAGALYDNDGE